MSQDNLSRFNQYLEMVRRGEDPIVAAQTAFPPGMIREAQKKAAKKQQQAAIGQTLGYVGGQYAINKGIDYFMPGKKAAADQIQQTDAGTPTAPTADQSGVVGEIQRTLGFQEGPGLGARLREAFATKPTVVPEVQGPPAPPMIDGVVVQGPPAPPTAAGFDASSLVGPALSGLAAYQGYRQFKKGDKVGGALGMGLGAAGAGKALGSSLAGSLMGPLAVGYGAYQLGNMALKGGKYTKKQTGSLAAQGALAGATIGSVIPVIGTAAGALIGGAIGATVGQTASSKGERQGVRDMWRKDMLESGTGLFGADYKGTLADGSTFNWGKDKFAFGTGEGELDLNKPEIAKAASYGGTLATLQGATGKAGEAIATQYLAAATNNGKNDMAKIKDNYRMFMNKLGITDLGAATNQINDMYNQGQISERERDVFNVELQDLFGSQPQQASQQRKNVAFRDLPPGRR